MINIQGVKPPVLQMGDLLLQICFKIFKNLTENVLLGTTCIDPFIHGMFPVPHEIETEPSAPVVILGRDTEAKVTSILSDGAPMNEQNEHAMIWVSKLMTILP